MHEYVNGHTAKNRPVSLRVRFSDAGGETIPPRGLDTNLSRF